MALQVGRCLYYAYIAKGSYWWSLIYSATRLYSVRQIYPAVKHLGKWQNGNQKSPFCDVWNIKETNVIIHCEFKISYEWASWIFWKGSKLEESCNYELKDDDKGKLGSAPPSEINNTTWEQETPEVTPPFSCTWIIWDFTSGPKHVGNY